MILIDVYLPAIDETYDFRLDEDAETEELTVKIANVISRKVDGIDRAETGFSLYDLTEERELDPGRTLAEQGVVSGYRLMLV